MRTIVIIVIIAVYSITAAFGVLVGTDLYVSYQYQKELAFRVDIDEKFFMFKLPVIENAFAQQTNSEFFKDQVSKSIDNPGKVYYYFESSGSGFDATYTNREGNHITMHKDSSSSVTITDCPSDQIAGSAIQGYSNNAYVYTAIIQNGNFIAWDEGSTKASAAGKCDRSLGGGCLIATATYGSELTPQVQQLRELRDNSLLQTASGTAFMSGFNQFYYSFSPTVADWERESPIFKEAVKITLTPMISSLSLLNHVDMDSEESVLGYGIALILLNVGMYFVAPAMVIVGIRKKF